MINTKSHIIGTTIVGYLAFVLLAGCGGAQKPMEEVARIPDDPSLLLPAECTAGIYLDVASVRRSTYYQDRRREIVEDLEPGERRVVEYFLEHTGALAMGFSFEGRKAGQDPHWVLALKGDFKEVGLLAFLAEMAGAGELKGLQQPKEVTPRQQGPYLEFFLDRKRRGLILDDRTVVLVSRNYLGKVLALIDDPKAKRFVDTELYKRMKPFAEFGKGTLSGVSSIPGNVSA